jgi:hypothetical protein
MRRVKAVWVGPAGQPGRLVWCWWQDGAARVLCGAGEQDLDAHVADGATVEVRAAGLTWTARVSVLTAGSAGWEALAAALPRVRLNPPDGPAAAASRWADARIVGLHPFGDNQPDD